MAYTALYSTTDIQNALIDIIAGFFVGIANNIVLIVFLTVIVIILEKVFHVFSGLGGMLGGFGRRR